MKLTHITIHCSATRPHQNIGRKEIRRMHINKGYRDIGYHYIIRRDGSVQAGRPVTQQGAHVKGHNTGNIGICLIGGLDANGKPVNNYTEEQFYSLECLVEELCSVNNIDYEFVCGHRDWYGDTNNDGIIDSHDWLKECPCFDVKTWLKNCTLQIHVRS